MKVDHISRIKKEKFLINFSETDFRDRIVRPLFFRLGYRDGRDLCGPLEKGKDAVFSQKDKLGFDELIAVQTKRSNLNLAREAHANLIEAITQIKIALNTTVTLLKGKQKVRPNKVILVASGTINDAARNHIAEEVKNPNIQFLDSDDLIPLIDDNFPEAWLEIDADIAPYFRAIEKLVSGNHVNTSDTDSLATLMCFLILRASSTDPELVE